MSYWFSNYSRFRDVNCWMCLIVAGTRNPNPPPPQPQQSPKPLYNNFVKPTGQLGQNAGSQGIGSTSGSVAPPPPTISSGQPSIPVNPMTGFETRPEEVVLNSSLQFLDSIYCTLLSCEISFRHVVTYVFSIFVFLPAMVKYEWGEETISILIMMTFVHDAVWQFDAQKSVYK